MKYIIILLIVLFSTTSFAEGYVGQGPGGSTIELRASYGILPYAHIKISDRNYNFYYKGTVVGASAGLAMSPFMTVGLYGDVMNLENEKNSGANKETVDVLNLGVYAMASLPIPLRPFAELGGGLLLTSIKQEGAVSLEQQYTSGLGGKLGLGFAPNFGGIGFFLQWEGHYYTHKGGEDKDNKSVKLFNLSQDSYAVKVGLSLSI